MKNKIILSSICFFCCGGVYAFGYDSPEMESGVPDTFRALTNSQQMAISSTKPVLTSEKGVEYKDLKVNGVVLRMVHVSGGTFGMGAQVAQPPVTSYDVTFDSLEGPVHQVTLSPYWIGQTEVTQALWMAVMGQDGRCSVDKSDYPVNNMDWYSCALFCNKLSVLAGLKPYYVFNSRKETLYGASGKDQKGSFDIYLTNGLREDAGADGFRLPTEAQWEYAARGGNRSHGYVFAGGNTQEEVGWLHSPVKNAEMDSSEMDYYMEDVPHKVAQLRANELGLYDMTGNVQEWCNDWADDAPYSPNQVTDPVGSAAGSEKMVRGGDCNTARYGGPQTIHSGHVFNRSVDDPGAASSGLRIVCPNLKK